jgi:hypothetical protein
MRILLASLSIVGTTSCGGSLPAVGPSRDSGQSSLMDETLAGKSCDAANHDKPFVIEWDATDMSIFEGRAATDVVFVKYEGCKLQVLDGCANDSIRGSLGAYRPVEWTSGSVERIEINNEGELYAKLPLGVATLGGRVHAGESFAMEYFVSGVRSSTRSAMYQGDLQNIAGCKGATHFVYGYALGAFALKSKTDVGGEVTAEVQGIGAGGKQQKTSKAEKEGGVLSTCRTETAKETRTCQIPIRLILRPLEAGASEQPAAPPPPASSEKAELTVEEVKLRESGARKRVAKDGKGCIADLDEADRRFPNSARLSTRPDGMMNIRAECLMLTGECDAGKKQLRMAFEALGMPAASIDIVVKSTADDLCPKP